MALEVFFTSDIINQNAAHLIAIIGANPGNVELCQGAWLLAKANVTTVGGDLARLDMLCRTALSVDVWNLLEVGNG